MTRPTSMQQVLRKPINVAIVLALVILAAIWLHTGQLQRQHETAAHRYLEHALADISRWQPAALRSQLSEAARQAVDEAQLAALMERYRPLGEFHSLQGIEFMRLTAALSLLGGDTLLGYSGEAHFAHGSARLSAVLVVTADGYRLHNFNLSSPELSPAP